MKTYTLLLLLTAIMGTDTMAEYKNHLANEKSPYLQQHASNPLDWYPWGEAAFAKAKAENKLIFLSIGYSTCHWCHVMEHESFEDKLTAEYFNKHFVSIKIDREERPDLDKIYMDVVVATTGSGGWPLTLFLTPDGKPIYGGTYFPKESKWGKPGLMDIASSILDAWANKKDQILKSANDIIKNVTNRKHSSARVELDPTVLDAAYKSFAASFDQVNGGFNRAPKFPSPHNLQLLLRYAQKKPESRAQEMVTTTLTKMYQGSIFDQLGGGFHRYSVDPLWRVPHFEKMLYDQAGLTSIYTEAWLATKNPLVADAVKKTMVYLKRDMLSENGLFYSAEDADSYTNQARTHKKEGAFYLWSWTELKQTLTPAEFTLIEKTYGIKKAGNIEDDPHKEFTGMNILHIEQLSDKPLLEKAKTKLLAARASKVRPHLDNKSLLSWNGMMISASAKAASAFDNKDYAGIAKKAADFILKKMMDKNYNLKHRYIQGEATIDGMLEDYAFFTAALIDLYQIDYDIRYLKHAKQLSDRMIELFWDKEDHGFYSTAKPPVHFANRQKVFDDNAFSSANSVAAMSLVRLSRILRDTRYEELTEQLINSISQQINQSPRAFSSMLMVLDFSFGPGSEFILAEGSDATETRKVLRQLKSKYIPNSVIIQRPYKMKKDSAEYKLMPWLLDMPSKDQTMRLYACENFTCQLPLDGHEACTKFVSEL